MRRSEKKAKNRMIFTIVLVIVLGYALLVWILPTLIGSLSFVNKFKKQPVAIQVVEDTTIAPPVLNIPYEATSTGTIKVHGYAQPHTKVEIYLEDVVASSITTNADGEFVSDDIDLTLGTNNLSGKTVDEKNHSSLSSKPIRIIYDNEKPKLDVSSPSDGHQQKGDRRITVSGSTDPDDSVSVSVNNSRVVTNGSGGFSHSVELSDGDNTITITATDSAGNSTQVVRKATYSSS
jgi:hypothetical protein